jgi:hypothetical protein
MPISGDLPPGGAPRRPSYQGRSPVLSVLLLVLYQISQSQAAHPQEGGCDLAVRHHTITVCDQHGLAAGSQPDIFAELGFEDFEILNA